MKYIMLNAYLNKHGKEIISKDEILSFHDGSNDSYIEDY